MFSNHLRFPLLALTASLLAAVPCSGQQQINAPGVIQAPPQVLKTYALKRGTIQDLTPPRSGRQNFTVKVFLGSQLCSLELRPHSILAANFKLLVDDGKTIKQVPSPQPTTYRGTVVGRAKSRVAASLINGQLWALIQMSDQEWGVQPLSAQIKNMPHTQHIVYRKLDVHHPNLLCGTANFTPKPTGTSGGGNSPSSANKLAEIGIDADYEYHRRYGSNVTNTKNAVTRVMNAVGSIYQRDVQIQYSITQIIVRTSAVYSGTDMNSLLTQFRSRWNSSHGNVKRDVAHMFTGRGGFSGIIGIAYMSVICNLGSAYGVSKAFSSNLSTNTGLVAHELGHNWSAPHCNSSNPCNIMCSGLGGCSRNLGQFSPTSISKISSFAASRSCLSSPYPPTLSSLSPTKTQSFGASSITLTGTRMSSVTAVKIGSATLGAGRFSIVNDNTIRLVPPPPASLGSYQVSVSNTVGNSRSLPLSFTDQAPILQGPMFALGGYPIEYNFGTRANNRWFFLVWVDSQNTLKYKGFNVLAPHIMIAQGTASGVGIGKLSITLKHPKITGHGLYGQFASFGGSLSNFTGTSNVIGSRFLGFK